MTTQDATLEYIDFLRQRGSISHIVRASPEASLSTLALTQRCLASGIAFPVPLPDGSVGVNVPGEIPPALSALGVVIEAVGGDPVEVGEGAEESVEETVSDAAAEAPAPPDPGPAASDVPGEECGREPVEDPDDAAPAGPDAPGEDAPFMAEEDVTAPDMIDMPPDAATLAEDPEITELTGMAADDAPADDLVFDDAPRDFPAPDDMAEDPVPGEEAPPVGDAVSQGEDTAAAPPVDMGAGTPLAPDATPDWAQSHLDILSDLSVRIDTLTSEQAGLAERLSALSEKIEEVATRPVPRPDATEFNLGMARVTVAVAQALRRLDQALDTLGAEPGRPDLGAALATGLSGIADAVRAVQGTGPAPDPAQQNDLTLIASMQETLSHQLATLIEAQQSAKLPAMEEFLLDLRHATADLLAEQERRARAG